MKSFYYIVVLFMVCFFAEDALAQTRTRGTTENNNTGLPELSVRARAKNEGQSVDINNVVWLRMLYRTIDLKQEANAPLYFPTEPIGDRMNLFTLMFKLITEGKLAAYQYIDGRELFTDQYRINNDLEEWLRSNNIVYRKTGTGASAVFTVDEIDIPSNEVQAYYVKEAYYFDQATGTFGSEVLAIAPIKVWEGDYGEPFQTPLFWVPYENLRPYISRSLIMTSNYNNALTYTADDFFQLKMYEGDIIKTVNMMNLTLAQQFPNDSLLSHARDSIETQLRDFEKRLWLPQENTTVTTTTTTTKASTDNQVRKDNPNTNRRQSVRGSRSNSSSSTKVSTPKTPKAEKTSSSPSRSVRRR